MTRAFACLFCLQVRFYEVVTPLQTLVAELQLKKNNLADDLESHRIQIKSVMEVNKAVCNSYGEFWHFFWIISISF